MHRRSLIARAKLWLPLVLYLVTIFYLSAAADPFPVLTTQVWDKLLHGLEYGALALLLCHALSGEGVQTLDAILWAVALTSLYGATDEYHQIFVPFRDANIRDWLADTIGAMIGAALYTAGRTLAFAGSIRRA
jgi:VanZ family protein